MTYLRIQYFSYLKELASIWAFNIAEAFDPITTGSSCNGSDDFIYDLSVKWGRNENSNNVMLGPNGYNGIYYNKKAEELGYRYFYSTNYEYFKSEYGVAFVNQVNMRYLQRCIDSNCTFFFCADPRTAPLGSGLHNEYTYLLNYYNNLWGTTFFKQNSFGFWFFSNVP